jgi:hypothetical protein
MSHFPLIYISSDDSSDSEISYYSDFDSGWSGYFPPSASSSTNLKPNKKVSTPAPAPAPSLSSELTQALTQALESALKNMKWPAQKKPARPERPPKQVIGLAYPRKQSSFDDKRKLLRRQSMTIRKR